MKISDISPKIYESKIVAPYHGEPGSLTEARKTAKPRCREKGPAAGIGDLLEAKRVIDLQHPETPGIEYFPKGEQDYIDPDDGFFFEYRDGVLVLSSTPNPNYSAKVLGKARTKPNGFGLEYTDKELGQTISNVWNGLGGRVDLNSKTITINKESANGKKRQRSIGNLDELKKVLTDLSRYGVTGDFRIGGVPKHIAKTVSQVMSQRDAGTDILAGRSDITLYHGTSASRLPDIMRRGLEPGHTGRVYNDLVPGYSDRNVYLALTEKTAEFYGKRQAKNDGDDTYVILTVRVPDPAKLLSDDAWVFGNPDNGSNKNSLRRSIRDSGELAYRGRIPPKFISQGKPRRA